MASISTNAFDLMRFPKARYAADANGKPVVVIPVDDESMYRIRNDKGGVSIQCSIVCQSKFNQPTSPTAPTHDFMQNLTKEQREAKIQEMLKFLNEHPQAVDGLVARYTDLKKQDDGTYRYQYKDGNLSEPKTMEKIAALITYERITFAPGWVIKAVTPQPTATANIQPTSEDDPFAAAAYNDPDDDLPF